MCSIIILKQLNLVMCREGFLKDDTFVLNSWFSPGVCVCVAVRNVTENAENDGKDGLEVW